MIRSLQGDYAVHFEDSIESVVRRVKGKPSAVLLADRQVAKLYSQPLAPLLEGMPTLLLDATEEEKTLTGVTKVVHWLQEQRCTRQTVVIALGGGIIQDVTTFSSHVYYRGIRWVFIPTTLLSMGDSCIGAKCGINLGEFKNQLGVFHSPSEVVICAKFLASLGEPAFLSGCGEMVRLMLTGPKSYFEEFQSAARAVGLHRMDLTKFIYRSLEVKKGIIEIDEHEGDLRRILNYGHTFGHALEAMTEYEVPHGLGVVWGLDLANYIACRRGILNPELFASINEFIKEHFPFRLSRPLDARELIQFAKRDKKVADGQINLVVMEEPGRLKIVKTPFDEALLEWVTEYIAGPDAFRGN
jgi:3-dehydroquinate synthase